MSLARGSLTKARWFAIKLAVTIAIFSVLFYKADIRSAGEALSQSSLGWLLLATVSYSSLYVTTMFKWDGLLRALGVTSSKWLLLKLDAIGRFASAFLPGTIGGDVLRWRLAGPISGGYVKTAASILVQRFTGVIGMVVLSVAAVLGDPSSFATKPVLILVGGGVTLLIGTLAVVSNRRWAVGLRYRTRRWRVRKLVALSYELHRTLHAFPRGPLLVAVGWSILFYIGVGFVLYFSCLAIGATITVSQSVFSVAIVSILTMLPISMGGLGLKQAGDVYVLGLIGVEPSLALAASLLKQIIVYAYTLLSGGGFFLLWKNEKPLTPVVTSPELTDAEVRSQAE